MKLLFVGGSGIISRAVTERCLAEGHELWLLNRGKHSPVAGARSLVADIADPAATRAALQGHDWDAVVQWIAFGPEDIRRDLELFRGRAKQYVFISSASIYEKPATGSVITEATPRVNPHWEYSRKKIAAELELEKAGRETGFPYTIVRPSLTYGDDQIPLVLNAWQQPWTAIDRLRRGAPLIIPGDGTSLWTITHNSDFATGLVGLLGHPQAIGEAFHVTSDEALPWNRFFALTAEAAGVANPRFVHIASDFIIACVPDVEGTLLGDKAVSAVFENSKLKRLVPGFATRTRFAEGIKRTLAWFEADPARQQINPELNARWDKVLAAYERGLQQAKVEFTPATR